MRKENVTNLVGKRLSDVFFTHSSSATLLGNRISRSRGSLHSCTGVFPCLFTSVKFASCSISNLVMANVGSLGGSCKDNNMHEKLVKMKHRWVAMSEELAADRNTHLRKAQGTLESLTQTLLQ